MIDDDWSDEIFLVPLFFLVIFLGKGERRQRTHNWRRKSEMYLTYLIDIQSAVFLILVQ